MSKCKMIVKVMFTGKTKCNPNTESEIYFWDRYEPCGSQTGVRVGERDCYESLSVCLSKSNTNLCLYFKSRFQ